MTLKVGVGMPMKDSGLMVGRRGLFLREVTISDGAKVWIGLTLKVDGLVCREMVRTKQTALLKEC